MRTLLMFLIGIVTLGLSGLGFGASYSQDGNMTNMTEGNASMMEQPETANELDQTDKNTQIIDNDTNIGNPKDDILNATEANLQDECMKLPNSTQESCP